MSEGLTQRSVNVAEESNKMVKNCLDNLIPNYFYLGFNLGSKFKKIKDLEKKLKNDDLDPEMLVELYNKGKTNIAEITNDFVCPNCKKKLTKEEGVSFCKYCGKEL